MEHFQSFEGPKMSGDDIHDPVVVRLPTYKGRCWPEVERCRKQRCHDCQIGGRRPSSAKWRHAFARSLNLGQGGTYIAFGYCNCQCDGHMHNMLHWTVFQQRCNIRWSASSSIHVGFPQRKTKAPTLGSIKKAAPSLQDVY